MKHKNREEEKKPIHKFWEQKRTSSGMNSPKPKYSQLNVMKQG